MNNRKTSNDETKSKKKLKPKQNRQSARNRLPSVASAQFITNQKFSYLKESLAPFPNALIKPLTENKESSPIKQIVITDDSPKLFSNTSNSPMYFKSMSPLTISPTSNKKTKKKKNKHGKQRQRQPSICVETTRTQKEQIMAITKEVEYLQKEVPHFEDIYHESQLSFTSSKRKKADMQAFALIQALSQWIIKYGNKAVKEYDEFKMNAETEMISMLGQIEDLHHENNKLNICIDTVQEDNISIKDALKEKQSIIQKLNADAQELRENAQTNDLNQQEINDLSVHLENIEHEKQSLNEKYDRLQGYYKSIQEQNDELAKKNYKLQGEMKLLNKELEHTRNDLKQQTFTHHKTVRDLEIEHENIQHGMKMEIEQNKIIAAANENDAVVFNITNSNDSNAVQMIVDDSEIEASGVMETDDGEYGVFTLSNEIDIDLYEYEDDQWLDETDDEYDDEPYPPSPMNPKTPPDADFVMEKQAISQDIIHKDASLNFTSETQSFGVETVDKSMDFEMESQKVIVDVLVPVLETEPEMQFESETTSISVQDTRRKSLDTNTMEMCTTSTSVIQAIEPPVDEEWQSTKAEVTGIEVEQKQFSSSSVSVSRENIIPKMKPVPKPRHDRPMTPEEQKIIMGGKNFKERLALFRKLEVTRGGRPQILAEAKAWALQNRWLTSKQVTGGDHGHVSKHVFKATIPKLNDSQTRGASIITITKTKRHTLRPRLYGYMKVIKCHFIPAYLLSQEPRFFFCLDGLPSKTNIRKSEPDFAKNRRNDFLTPCLFFFATKEKFEEFSAAVKQEPVRSVKFQKAFAQFAKGIYPLNEYVADINVDRCLAALKAMKGGFTVRLPKGEEDTRAVNDKALFLCNSRECHRFHLTDKHSRNAWMKKISKLVNKRKATYTPSATSELTYNATIAEMVLPVVSSLRSTDSQISSGGIDDSPMISDTIVSLKYKPSAAEMAKPVFGNTGSNKRNSPGRSSSSSTAERLALSKIEGEFD